jgi:competence protein ComEC
LRALTTGDRSDISEQTVGLMRRTGTSHMLAISGYHIGVVAGFVVLILRAFLGILSLFRPQGFSARWVWVGGFAAASYYAFAVGMPVSAQRALVALAFYAGGRFFGRKTTVGTLVGLAMVALVWFDPAAIGSPSFQLSFGAMIGIVRVYPRLIARIPSDLPLLIDKLLRAMAISVAAIVGTLPTALWWFQELSVVGPIANLIAGPLMGGIVIPLAFVGSVFSPLEVVCGALADHVLDLNFALLSMVDAPLIYFGITASLMLAWTVVLLWPRDRQLWMFGICCAILQPVPMFGTNLTFLPVGQGDAVLVQFQDGRTWLVDGGPSPMAVVRWLRRQRIYRLDVVVATHDHPDHTTGLATVLSQLQVGELWLPGGGGFASLRAVSDTPLIENPAGRLWPPETPDTPLSENDRSLVLSLQSQGCVALLTGDIETESDLSLSLVDLLKVAHHGSKTSTSTSFVGSTLPLVAVAQMGVGNSFGHPHTEVVSRLNAAGTRLYRTDLDGLVTVNLRDGWLRVFSSGDKEDHKGQNSHHQGNPLRCRDGLAKH